MNIETEKAIIELVRFLRKHKKKIYYEHLVRYLRYNEIDEYKTPRAMGQGLKALYWKIDKMAKDLAPEEKYNRIREELKEDQRAILRNVIGKDGKKPWEDKEIDF